MWSGDEFEAVLEKQSVYKAACGCGSLLEAPVKPTAGRIRYGPAAFVR